MLARLKIAHVIRRCQSTSASSGIWSDFSRRSASLSISDPELKKSVLGSTEPVSLEPAQRRAEYHAPDLIDETFKAAYEILQKESESIYAQIDKTDPAKVAQVEDLKIRAEKYNPEVLYNSTFKSAAELDMSQPVYRKLAKKQWEEHDLMVTMQRLEQLHVIPDTMPTLEPTVNVQVKFPHNTDAEFADWIAPGTVLPAFAVSRPPTIRVQAYDSSDKLALYTVLIVNPDTPDLAKNSYTTKIHYGLANVPLDFVNNTIDTKTLLNNGSEHTFVNYLPLTPEKNAQNQRAALWVFKQSESIPLPTVESETFDIRQFAESNGLTAVGAHVWRQTFDRSVNAVREQYGLGKGRVFERVRGVKLVKA